jgi:hypothetical protein
MADKEAEGRALYESQRITGPPWEGLAPTMQRQWIERARTAAEAAEFEAFARDSLNTEASQGEQ